MEATRKIPACFVLAALMLSGIQFVEAAEIIALAPDSVPVPFKNRYSHGKLVPAGAEWLFTAGQTGVIEIHGEPQPVAGADAAACVG